MKIIAFGDVHMSTQKVKELAAAEGKVDLVVVSGDLTNFGGRDDARRVLGAVRELGGELLALPGNLDRPEVVGLLEEEGVSLHGRGVRRGELGIFGCGCSNLTPLNTPGELPDEEITSLLERGAAEVEGAPLKLMVCHTPPHATRVDRLASGSPAGSPAVRAFIERRQPNACVVGHIHEAAGEDRIGLTHIVNPGRFSAGGYVAIQVDDAALSVALRRL